MSRVQPAVLALLVIGLLGGQAGVVAGQGMVTVTVTLVDPAGDPIPQAELIASWSGGSTAEVTKANGQALVDVPQGATVSFSVNHQSYVRNHPFTLQIGDTRELTITAFPAGSATVTVRDENGPVEDARVQFRKDGSLATEGRTGTDGTVRSGEIETGSYTVSVFKEGYYRTTREATIGSDTSLEMSIEKGFATVAVSVRDDHFSPSRPIEGATISVPRIGSVVTQSNGIQRVNIPVNTRVAVRISKEGYETREGEIAVAETDKQVNFTIRRTPEIVLDRFNERVVVGENTFVRVADEYGDPVDDATLYVNGNEKGTTDANGEVTFTIASPGEYTIWVAEGGLESERHTITGVEAAAAGGGAATTATPTASDDLGPLPQPGFGAGSALLALLALLATLFIAATRRRG